MKDLAIRRQFRGNMAEVIQLVTERIKTAGFGVLTRIDFDQKIKEKLGEDLPPVVVLGACHPKLAHEAFKQDSDVALLIPCNLVFRDLGQGQVAVEMARPMAMLKLLPKIGLEALVAQVESDLEKAFSN